MFRSAKRRRSTLHGHSAAPGELSAKPRHLGGSRFNVVAVLLGSPMDLRVLSFLLRFAEDSLSHHIELVVPCDVMSFDIVVLNAFVAFREDTASLPNVSISVQEGVTHGEVEALTTRCLASPSDLFLCSFVVDEWTHESSTRGRVSSREEEHKAIASPLEEIVSVRDGEDTLAVEGVVPAQARSATDSLLPASSEGFSDAQEIQRRVVVGVPESLVHSPLRHVEFGSMGNALYERVCNSTSRSHRDGVDIDEDLNGKGQVHKPSLMLVMHEVRGATGRNRAVSRSQDRGGYVQARKLSG
jgi:hypothetical protein